VGCSQQYSLICPFQIAHVTTRKDKIVTKAQYIIDIMLRGEKDRLNLTLYGSNNIL